MSAYTRILVPLGFLGLNAAQLAQQGLDPWHLGMTVFWGALLGIGVYIWIVRKV